MNIKLAFICLLLISGIVSFLLYDPVGSAQSTPTTISGKFYKYDMVAVQGQNSFSNLNIPSINDTGTIAFGAGSSGPGGSGIFMRRISGPALQLFSEGTYFREV